MSLSSTTTIDRDTPRSYECGHSGLFSPAQLIRYVQPIRFRNIGYFYFASVKKREETSANTPWRFLLGNNGNALNAQQRVHIYEELDQHPYEIVSWIQRVGRSSADAAHEFRYLDAKSGETRVAARVLVTLVKVDQTTNKPSPIFPPGQKSTYQIEDSPDFRSVAPRLPPKVLPPPHAYRWNLQVRSGDLDPNNHITNSAYADFVEDARFAAAFDGKYAYHEGSHAIPANEMAKRQTRQVCIDYVREEHFDAKLEMVTWIPSGETRQFAFILYNVNNPDKPIVTMRALVVVSDPADGTLNDTRHESGAWKRHYAAKL